MSRSQIALETQILTEFTTTLKVGGEGLGRSDKEKSDFFLHSPSFAPPPPPSFICFSLNCLSFQIIPTKLVP